MEGGDKHEDSQVFATERNFPAFAEVDFPNSDGDPDWYAWGLRGGADCGV